MTTEAVGPEGQPIDPSEPTIEPDTDPEAPIEDIDPEAPLDDIEPEAPPEDLDLEALLDPGPAPISLDPDHERQA